MYIYVQFPLIGIYAIILKSLKDNKIYTILNNFSAFSHVVQFGKLHLKKPFINNIYFVFFISIFHMLICLSHRVILYNVTWIIITKDNSSLILWHLTFLARKWDDFKIAYQVNISDYMYFYFHMTYFIFVVI